MHTHISECFLMCIRTCRENTYPSICTRIYTCNTHTYQKHARFHTQNNHAKCIHTHHLINVIREHTRAHTYTRAYTNAHEHAGVLRKAPLSDLEALKENGYTSTIWALVSAIIKVQRVMKLELGSEFLVSVCMCVCACVCVYMHMYIYVYTHIICIYAYIYIYIYIHT